MVAFFLPHVSNFCMLQPGYLQYILHTTVANSTVDAIGQYMYLEGWLSQIPCTNMYLVDVTCPNEQSENLVAARRRKIEKYQSIKDRLTEQGFDTTLDAFVVGMLGTWDPENDRLLSLIGIGRKYGNLFKKLCCRDAISGSYEVWACRCRRHFQRSFPR